MVDLAEAVFQGSPHGLAVIDRSGRLLRHNRRFSQVLGASGDSEFTGCKFRDLWQEDSRSLLDAFLQDCLGSPGKTRQITSPIRAEEQTGQVDITGRALSAEVAQDWVLLTANQIPPDETPDGAQEGITGETGAASAFFAAAFGGLDEACFLFRPGTDLGASIIVAANAAAETLLGESQPLNGRSIAEMTAGRFSATALADAEKGLARGTPNNHICLLEREGGNSTLIECKLWPIRPDIAGIPHWAARCRVLSETQATGTREGLSPILLDEAVDRSRVGIWHWDLQSNLAHHSKRLWACLGYDVEQIENYTDFSLQITHPEDRETRSKALRQALEEGTPYEYVARFKAADGTYHPVRILGEILCDDNGMPRHLVGVETDATEERLLRDRLLRAEEIAKMGNWAVTLDPPGIDWSPGVYRVHGVDPKAFKPSLEGLDRLFHEDDVHVLKSAMERTLHLGKPNRGETDRERARIVLPDGQLRHCELNAVPERDEAGQITGAVGTIQDITDLVEIEQKFSQAQKMEMVGHLAGGVAHDFNNLLAVVMGNLELIQEVPDTDEHPEFVDAALAAVRRGSELTRNLLSFARKAPLEPKRFDLNRIIDEDQSMLRRLLPRTIKIERELASELWTAHIDRSSFDNALLNLVINARDAMPSGGVLTVETENKILTEAYTEERQEDLVPGPYVVVSVSDTGTGIEPEMLSEVFAPFFTTKITEGGSGLGLSMVQGFAKQSSGGVRIYSEPGIGTTVKLFFPASLLDVSLEEKFDSTVTGEKLQGRILLVEDDVAVNKVLARRLKEIGLDCVSAGSGDEAVRIVEQGEHFDLLLTDIVMPGTYQGPDLARYLRRAQADLRVIFISGYPNEATIHGNGLTPEDIRLMKPVSRDELMQALKRALAEKSA